MRYRNFLRLLTCATHAHSALPSTSLRRRFQQNQEDCAFTLLALLPTLAKQVLDELDVEALTAELQRRAEETRREKLQAAEAPAPVAAEQQKPELEESRHRQLTDTGGSTVLVEAQDAGQEHASSDDKLNGSASHAELNSAEAGQVKGEESSLEQEAPGEEDVSVCHRGGMDVGETLCTDARLYDSAARTAPGNCGSYNCLEDRAGASGAPRSTVEGGIVASGQVTQYVDALLVLS